MLASEIYLKEIPESNLTKLAKFLESHDKKDVAF
jgi:hypothetical protein